MHPADSNPATSSASANRGWWLSERVASSERPMPILRNGQRLGVYTVQNMLGQGGMAEVYRATHETLDREVAIKVLNPTFNNDPTFPLRFLREAKASARLNHPNIITVYDFDEKGEIAYLVMELATGGTLSDQSRRITTLREAVAALAPVL